MSVCLLKLPSHQNHHEHALLLMQRLGYIPKLSISRFNCRLHDLLSELWYVAALLGELLATGNCIWFVMLLGVPVSFQVLLVCWYELVPVQELLVDLSPGSQIVADKGYISQKLFVQLFKQDLTLITSVRKNMKNRLMPLEDKLLLRKRSIIETINDQLKNISQIEHSRHRSLANFLANLLAGLITYCLRPIKPAFNLNTYGNSSFSLAL